MATTTQTQPRPVETAVNNFIASYTEARKEISKYDGKQIAELTNAIDNAHKVIVENYSNDKLQRAASSAIVTQINQMKDEMNESVHFLTGISARTGSINSTVGQFGTLTDAQLSAITNLKNDISNGYFYWIVSQYDKFCKENKTTDSIKKWAEHIKKQNKEIKDVKDEEIKLVIKEVVSKTYGTKDAPKIEEYLKNSKNIDAASKISQSVEAIRAKISLDNGKKLYWENFFESHATFGSTTSEFIKNFAALKTAYGVKGEIYGGCKKSTSSPTKIAFIVIGILLMILVLIVVIIESRPKRIPIHASTIFGLYE